MSDFDADAGAACLPMHVSRPKLTLAGNLAMPVSRRNQGSFGRHGRAFLNTVGPFTLTRGVQFLGAIICARSNLLEDRGPQL